MENPENRVLSEGSFKIQTCQEGDVEGEAAGGEEVERDPDNAADIEESVVGNESIDEENFDDAVNVLEDAQASSPRGGTRQLRGSAAILRPARYEMNVVEYQGSTTF